MTPQYRIEQYLAAIKAAYLGETPLPEYPAEPAWRIERFLAAILSAAKSDSPVMACPDPVWRVEEFLRAIYDALTGSSPAWPCPASTNNIEAILRAIYKVVADGTETEAPAPSWDIERWLLSAYDAAKEGGGTEDTVSGNAPITLAWALARPLISLTQYGLCTQASTPSQADPVPIKCNNGTLCMVDDELPAGYKRVLGFTCNNNAMWEITGFHLKGSDTVRIGFSVTAACNVFGCYQGTDATDNYDLYVSTTSGSKYLRYGNGTYLSYWSNANLGQRFDVVFSPTGTQGMPDDSTWTERSFTAANDLLIGSTTTTGTSSKLKGNLYGDIVVDGRLKLIPCERVSDNVLGYYDTYSETFYEPSTGFDGAVSLGYDDSHCHLDIVGTPEVLTIGDQTASVESLLAVGGTKDEQDIISGVVTRRCGVCYYDGTQIIGDTYVSETGGKDVGAIIVYTLASPVVEQVTPLALRASEGTNTVSVTAEVSPVTLSATYKREDGVLKTVSGALVHIADALDRPAESVSASITPTQNLNGYSKPWAGGTGKNLLPDNYVGTTDGDTTHITYTKNPDGSVVVASSGAATRNAYYRLFDERYGSPLFKLPPGDYTLSTGQNITGVFIFITLVNNGTVVQEDIARSDTNPNFTIPSDLTYTNVRMAIDVLTGYTINTTIYPMIRIQTVTDATWEPYANVCPISGSTGLSAYRNGRNFLQYPYYHTTKTESGVTFTDNGDGSVTIVTNGASTGIANFSLIFNEPLPNGSYKFVFTSTAATNAYCGIAQKSTDSFTNKGVGEETTISVDDGNLYWIRLRLPTGANISTPITIYPMLRLATETDTSWEPYTSTTYVEDWAADAGTVYAGSIDIVSGALKARPQYASYNGETLTGPWLSSLDEYVAGTTPTTGAQVVDLGGTETAYQLTAQEVKMLLGDNYVWSSTGGNVSVTCIVREE